MKPIPFSYVNARKLALQSNSKREKISYNTVSKNLTPNNLLLFIESSYENMDSHYKTCFALYDRLCESTEVSDIMKRKLENAMYSNLIKIEDVDTMRDIVYENKSLSPMMKDLFFDSFLSSECSDRVIRNDTRIAKRFDFNKTINDNIFQGCRHTVFELCSLIDTYDMSSKAKMNVALENVSYALFKSGHEVDLNDAIEFVTEYFLTRDTVITDKQYKGYVSVLKNNNFVDSTIPNISYVFEAKSIPGNSYTDKAKVLITQCETKECAAHMSQLLNIKNEKQASNYIDTSVDMIIADNITKNDSLLLLKSIYCLPLIGDVSDHFVNYKLEMSRKKAKIKKKLTGIQNEKIVRDILDDGEMIDMVSFVSESVHFENYILDDAYVDETDPVKILESEGQTDNIQDIINAFKASNEKSPSKFKNMISRIMTKSPENIINGTPNLFGTVRIMMYLAVSAAVPLGPVFAAILALVNKVITMNLDVKQAEKLLKYLKSEKEKTEKKLEKLSGKEKENQKEYIKCLDDCIKKVSDFIMKIDDENEEANDSADDGFDFDFDDDFSFESAVLESSIDNSVTSEIKKVLSDYDIEILSTLVPLFDNSSRKVTNEFYDMISDIQNNCNDPMVLEACADIIINRGKERIVENSFIVEFEANELLKQILTEAKEVKKKSGGKFDLNTLKMMMINFKKKFRDLKGKEQEIWRNIDIATTSLTRGIQQALTSDRREAIIKGSIIPSFSKCIKSAIVIGGASFVNPVYGVITAVGMFAASKYLNEKERRLLYDEIDTELQVVEKQIQMAENEGNMNQYRFLLNYQKKLTREKHRIKYGVHMQGRTIPEIKGRD